MTNSTYPTQPDESTEEVAAAVTDPLDGVFHPDGTADDAFVPTGAPLLTSGSADTVWVPRLIEGLNKTIDADLPLGTVVTSDVLAAVTRLRAQYDVPIENQIVDARAHVTPNVWAAIEALTA